MDFAAMRLAFRTAGIALVVAGVVAGIIEDKGAWAAATTVALGVILVFLTSIIRKN